MRATATSELKGMKRMTRMHRAGAARESDAIQHVTDRLRRQFPKLAPNVVDSAVHRHYHEFDRSRIRDFVPILVERSVRSELRRSTYRSS